VLVDSSALPQNTAFYATRRTTAVGTRTHYMRTALFWAITQRVVAIYYRRFGTICRAHRGSKMGPTGCPETSVRNYHYSLRNDPDKRSSNLLRGGPPKIENPLPTAPYVRPIPYMIKTARYYNATLKCVRVTSVTVEQQDVVHILSVSAALVIQYAEHMRHIIPSSVACPALLYCPTIPHQRGRFSEKKSLNTKCVLFFYNFI